METQLNAILPDIIKIRRHIHANPELRYEEHETSQLIQNFLRENGYEDLQIYAGTGVSVVVDSDKPGKTVALRGDIDALPITEQTNLAYASQKSGLMHACGHDGHTATLLAVAATLPKLKDQFTGKIKLIFQPAEEGGAGAAKMIEEGVLENPTVDAIFGYHNMPIAQGKVGVKPKCVFAGADFLSMQIFGKGGHAAYPEKTIDPILIGAKIINELQSINQRSETSEDQIVLTVTEFQGGNTFNVVPPTSRLTISLRTTTHENRAWALAQCNEISTKIANAYGGKVEISTIMNCPPTINTYAESELVANAAKKIVGAENVIALPQPTMATEDFSFFLEKVPGCFFWVGNGDTNPALHTPHYDFQDEIIPIAAQVLMQSAFDFLNE